MCGEKEKKQLIIQETNPKYYIPLFIPRDIRQVLNATGD